MNHVSGAVWDAAVIGGGPAGAVCAATLARYGRRVILLDRDARPRCQRVESLSPTALSQLRDHGTDKLSGLLVPKAGGTFVWGADRTPFTTYYGDQDETPRAAQVRRDDLDPVLLHDAEEHGVVIRRHCSVTEIVEHARRPYAVRFDTADGDAEEITARWIVDASGRNAVLARQLGLLCSSSGLPNRALWGYWEPGRRLAGRNAGNSLFVSHGHACLWYLPADDRTDLVSVGAVLSDARQSAEDEEICYHQVIGSSAGIAGLLAAARRVSPVYDEPVHAYCASQIAGPGWVLVGDAAWFVDPLLTPGIQLAVGYGKAAAQLVNTVLDQPHLADDATSFYDRCYRTEYETYVDLARTLYAAAGDHTSTEDASVLTSQPAGTADRSRFFSLITGIAPDVLPATLGSYFRSRQQAASYGAPPPVPGEEEGFRFLTGRVRARRLAQRGTEMNGELAPPSRIRLAAGVRVDDHLFLPAPAGSTLVARPAVSNRFGDRFLPTDELRALLRAVESECTVDDALRRFAAELGVRENQLADVFPRWLRAIAEQGLIECELPSRVGGPS